MRTLHRTGFIEVDAERPGPNGIIEKPYRDTAKSWSLDVDDTTASKRLSNAVLDAFVAEVAEVDGQLVSTARQALNLNRSGLAELTTRLAEVLEDFEGRNDADGDPNRPSLRGVPYAVFIAIHRRPVAKK